MVEQQLLAINDIAITTDGWTSRAIESYITYTAHFINESFELCSYVLQTIELPGSHTAIHLEEAFKYVRFVLKYRSVELAWKLQNKINAVVTDRAANMKAAILQRKLPWIPCFAHVLHSAITKGLFHLNDVREKARKIVGHFKHSALATRQLQLVFLL